MAKTPTVHSDPPPFSEKVPFPTAELEFLDGLRVSLRPDYGMTHSVMGVHYVLEAEDKEGQIVAIKVTFSSRRRNFASGPGPEFERYLELEPRRGKPLACTGKEWGFEFKAKHPSFVPQNSRYTINRLTPDGGFTMELDSYSLNRLQLFYEAPPKGRSEADI